MLKKFIVILLLIILTQGCDSTEPPIVKNEPLIPLSEGNYWLYREYDLNPDGTGGTPRLWKFGFIIEKTSGKVPSDININNYELSRCAEDLSPIDDTGYSLYGGSKLVYQDENGFFYSGIMRQDTITMIFDDLIFLYPTEISKSVSGHVFYYGNAGNTSNVPDNATTQYTCISMDSLFTTPIGDFRCLVYRMTWQDFEPLFRNEVYYFIKPGLGIVGMVQKVFHYSSNQFRYISKILLTDYEIKMEETK